MKKIKVSYQYILLTVLLVVLYYFVGCPFRYLTGLTCPGCGMTRAVFSFVQLDFQEAFHYHPLVFLLPVLFVIYCFRRKIPDKIQIVIFVFVLLLFLIVYLIRLMNKSDIVAPHFTDGLFYQIKKYFIKGA